MALELSSEWIPGTIYKVVCETTCSPGEKPSVPASVFNKHKSPLYSLSAKMSMGAMSSDMYMRLKAERQETRFPIDFGDKLLFIEEIRDMRFRNATNSDDGIYYEHYKKVLLGSKVLWLHRTSHHESATYVRFWKLRA